MSESAGSWWLSVVEGEERGSCLFLSEYFSSSAVSISTFYKCTVHTHTHTCKSKALHCTTDGQVLDKECSLQSLKVPSNGLV